MTDRVIDPQGPPLPTRQVMSQWWRDIAFLHWRVDPAAVAPLLPRGVRPDVHDGSAWVGLIPFRMVDAGVARGPGVPWAGSFLETNVRLYSVDDTGRRGIVFLSLDTDRSLVVAGARAAFGLPYRWARMRHRADGDVHAYDARLRWPGTRGGTHVVVRAGAPRAATPLDAFVSARWGLHVRWWGRTLYVANRHEPWPLRDAEVLELDDGLLASVGLGELAHRPPDHVAFSDGVHTEFSLPTNAARAR